MVFQQKLLEKTFVIVEITGPAMVLPVSSDFWKAPCLSIIWKVTCKHQIWGRFNLYVLLLRATFHTTPLFFYAGKQVEIKRQRKSTLRDNSRGLYHLFHHRQLILEHF